MEPHGQGRGLLLRRMKRITIFTVLMAIIFFAAEAGAADWKYFYTTKDGNDYYYDTQSVLHGQDTSKVWTKYVLSDKAKADYIKIFQSIAGIENISYILGRAEIDCSKNVMRIISIVRKDSEGGVIHSRDFPNNTFTEIIPESIGATLFEIICKENKK
jgi:hypothetical protein